MGVLDRLLGKKPRAESLQPKQGAEARPGQDLHLELTAVPDANALVDRLSDPDPVVRQEAERALVSLGDGAVDALLQQGRGMRNLGDPAARWYAARVLGQIGGGRAIAALSIALMDHDEDVVVEATEGLGRIGDDSAARVLRTFAGSPHDEILRDRARSAAEQIERRR